MIFRGTRSRAPRMAARPNNPYVGGVIDEVMNRAWPRSVCFLPTTLQGRPGRTNVLFEAGLAMGQRPAKRCRSGLSAISLGYRRRDELSASGAARACAMGGAPVRKCGGIDVNTQHDVSIGLDDRSGGCNLRLARSGVLRSLGPSRWGSANGPSAPRKSSSDRVQNSELTRFSHRLTLRLVRLTGLSGQKNKVAVLVNFRGALAL